MIRNRNKLKNFFTLLKLGFERLTYYFLATVYFGKSIPRVPNGSWVILPCQTRMFNCGLAGIVSFKRSKKSDDNLDLSNIEDMLLQMESRSSSKNSYDARTPGENGFGGPKSIRDLEAAIQHLKSDHFFYDIYNNSRLQQKLTEYVARLQKITATQKKWLSDNMGTLPSKIVDNLYRRIEALKDVSWSISSEILENIKKISDLYPVEKDSASPGTIKFFKSINAVLNSIDRLEVRGRDSAGISIMLYLTKHEFENFNQAIIKNGLKEELDSRMIWDILVNRSISINETKSEHGIPLVGIAVIYKVAAEIGNLGDNIKFLRKEIQNDPIFQILSGYPLEYQTILSHTRWASVGSITEPNCHPVDNRLGAQKKYPENSIHVCLNGDIDNYLTLKNRLTKSGACFDEDISTDTKIIPLQIQQYFQKGNNITEAFRLAVNDFEGSHAISMHTDLAPGTIFLAQKGSGQAIFVGLAKDHYIATSEVYGFIEETDQYLKIDGERVFKGKTGNTQGQIFFLSQESCGGVNGITAMHYDGTPLTFQKNIQMSTDITSRDIDRQNFPHYFLKEISESPRSVERTLQNRWKISEDGGKHHMVVLNEKEMPQKLKDALIHKKIKRIFFVGQGTAGVAALACANILSHYMKDPSLYVGALKASEFSGFMIDDSDVSDSMSDTLVVAISQSGTTTDTNRTIDMIREKGAYTMAIVNRRDSDISFKVDGVIYTSSGRDIEMSVASTKAFYSQIIAGAMLGLYITDLKNCRTKTFISEEIKQLLKIPHHMKSVLKTKHLIEKSASRLAVSNTYWAAVGSGPNKVAADEIRIKLSELCYKTISSDYIEDKKHIDLSSEPLIIVCTSGTKGTVIGDIVKDTAIFHAHKATPVVIADENEHRFDAYAEDVFYVPIVSQHLAPLLNTLVGHIWGYYAALAINEGSRFLYRFRENIQKTINEYIDQGLDIYEIVLEKSFREEIAYFYTEFRKKKTEKRLPTTIGLDTASDLPMLLKYLSGRLPVTDFELDFGCKGTAKNMIKMLYKYLGESINHMARPVDAIKHQAKTVTVGTSRIPEKIEGLIFKSLSQKNFNVSHLTNKNVIVLKNLQSVIDRIKGSVLYRIDALNFLGEPTEKTTIKLIAKDGSSSKIRSRVEDDNQLKGTKRIIVREGNAYIGKGRRDDRSILIIPIISASSDKPNVIEHLYLLNISFQTDVALLDKIKALGGKYKSIKSIVQENSLTWDDSYLELFEIEDLFGRSAEKIGETTVAHFSQD